MIHRKTTSLANLSETKRLLYFAYGSNLNREQLHHRCPDAKPLCPAYLAGYRLAERKFADIEKDADSVVHGALYSITPADLESLDIYEGYPDGYTRNPIPATQENGLIRTAWVYMMTPEYRNNLDGQPYSAAYRKIVRTVRCRGTFRMRFPGKDLRGRSDIRPCFRKRSSRPPKR